MTEERSIRRLSSIGFFMHSVSLPTGVDRAFKYVLLIVVLILVVVDWIRRCRSIQSSLVSRCLASPRLASFLLSASATGDRLSVAVVLHFDSCGPFPIPTQTRTQTSARFVGYRRRLLRLFAQVSSLPPQLKPFPTFSDEEIRNSLELEVKKHKYWRSSAVNNMKIIEIESTVALRVGVLHGLFVLII
ncbi:unnamed protein product [Soboliphyme baturini]|uniref:Homeobox domain-containing protein n=1 Tax=Soboliphyme baturini TaxID=241478 RepID=A0A183IP06_9BILA|nr:unnamed protein product [Soboliphyme baturini]